MTPKAASASGTCFRTGCEMVTPYLIRLPSSAGVRPIVADITLEAVGSVYPRKYRLYHWPAEWPTGPFFTSGPLDDQADTLPIATYLY